MRAQYKVEGMTCGGCAASVKKAIGHKLPGVTVEVDLAQKAVEVLGAHEEEAVKEAVEDAGFSFLGQQGG
ncbi:MAG: heavy-metal-associated domain-containing protein [Myxococcota bacterium]